MLLTPKVTLSRWGAEIRGLDFLLGEDFGAERWKQDWDPDVRSTMTLTALVVSQARYLQVGKMVWFKLVASFTTGGVASTIVSFDLPINQGSDGEEVFNASINDGGNRGATAFTDTGGDLRIVVFRSDGANWGLGASRILRVTGWYQSI